MLVEEGPGADSMHDTLSSNRVSGIAPGILAKPVSEMEPTQTLICVKKHLKLDTYLGRNQSCSPQHQLQGLTLGPLQMSSDQDEGVHP